MKAQQSCQPAGFTKGTGLPLHHAQSDVEHTGSKCVLQLRVGQPRIHITLCEVRHHIHERPLKFMRRECVPEQQQPAATRHALARASHTTPLRASPLLHCHQRRDQQESELAVPSADLDDVHRFRRIASDRRLAIATPLGRFAWAVTAGSWVKHVPHEPCDHIGVRSGNECIARDEIGHDGVAPCLLQKHGEDGPTVATHTAQRLTPTPCPE